MNTHATAEMSHPICLCYQYDPSQPEDPFDPDAGATGPGLPDFPAVKRLRDGNETLAGFRAACAVASPSRSGAGSECGESFTVKLSPLELGLGEGNGFPVQRPFAAVLGCADARVPAEVLFGQGYNSLFVVRVAGNTLDVAGAAAGSLHYALTHFVGGPSYKGGDEEPRLRLRLAVVLGHRNCGAVSAAVKEYQKDPWGATLPEGPLSSVLRPIFFPTVQVAARAFDQVFGQGASNRPENEIRLTEVAVYLNAAWSAHHLSRMIEELGVGVSSKVRPCYGVFDVSDFRVRARPTEGYDYPKARHASDAILAAPPDTSEQLLNFGVELARNLKKLGDRRPEADALPPKFFSDR